METQSSFSFQFPVTSSELETFYRELQFRTLNIVTLFLATIGVILFGLGIQNPQQEWFYNASLGLFAVLLLVWLVRRVSFFWASTLLVLGCFGEIYYLIGWAQAPTVVTMVLIPASLATLTLGIWGGCTAATLASLLLWVLPFPWLPLPITLRWAGIAEMWASVAMIWLALQPLLRSVEWTWEAYENSQDLLKQARQAQAQLQQALEDAAAANQQLVRLNQLAQSLRQIAEGERQAKQQFVANVSHELRTPFNMIVGFCEVILKKPAIYGKRSLPQALLADLEVVFRNSQHLSELIDDVLDLSQIEAGKMVLIKERVSLPEIIEAAIIAIHPLYASKGLSLQKTVPADLPLLYCDRTRIREVLLNLLSNAGRFTNQGGVQIEVRQVDGMVMVSVADTGMGMSSDVQEKLFQPFQQAELATHQRYGGTGLGLAISKRFVELHEGKMWVESQEGVGTTFYFQLPIEPPIPLQATPMRWLNQWAVLKERSHPPQPFGGLVPTRLVVVEQGDVMQKLLNRYLENCEIVSLPGLDEALADIHRTPAQMLLVNGLSSQETLARLAQSSALPYSTPAIVCPIPGTEEASNALGATSYLVKPISEVALLASINAIEPTVHRILLVDDEPDALQLFRRILLSTGRDYRVLRATNGRQALEVLEDNLVDVILLDLSMPEMDGYQFLSIRNQVPRIRDIPVILISARHPTGEPIASSALTITRGGGLPVSQIMSCVKAMMSILSPNPPTAQDE
jgi:signal transduction histidine kinase/CheY-like chemotaxis protein